MIGRESAAGIVWTPTERQGKQDILVIGASDESCRRIIDALHGQSVEPDWVIGREEGIRAVGKASYAVVVLDDSMRDTGARTTLRTILAAPSRPEVIVVGNPGSPEDAGTAIKLGAWDYIQHSSLVNAISLSVMRAVNHHVRKLPEPSQHGLPQFPGIIGTSRRMVECLRVAEECAQSDANVLLFGETGTGKELLASAIHANSPRAHSNFVIVDCTALPEHLVDSTLFGHEKGAFTGAERPHVGLIRQADGGTLFLDEVSELPLAVQSSFLRVLEEHTFRTVGGTKEQSSDFRLIAASNRRLEEMVSRQLFRKDLLYRIRAFTIDVPPLRERPEDIPELIAYYVPRLCAQKGLPVKQVSADFVEALAKYSWPGNVRELVHALERAIVAAQEEPDLYLNHLPTPLRVALARLTASGERATKDDRAGVRVSLPPLHQVRLQAIAEAERRYLHRLVDTSGGNVADACRLSGLSRSRLYGLLKKHGIGFHHQR